MTKRSKAIWHSRRGVLLIVPGLVLFLFFFLYPIIYSIKLSTTNASIFNLIKGPEFIGLKYYKDLLLKAKLYLPLLRTIIFIGSSVPLKIFIAMLLAILFNSKFVKFRQVLYPFILIPWAIPWFLSVMIWRGMFNVDFGVINQLLKSIGLPTANWLNGIWSAFVSYNIVEVWLTYPFIMSIIISAMQSIPKDFYEMAMIDGANPWSSFRYITLPLIKNSLLWVTLIQVIASYMIFGVPYLLNKGGPAGSNEFLMVYVYKQAFNLGRYGFASAFVILVFFMLTILIILYSKLTKLTEEE